MAYCKILVTQEKNEVFVPTSLQQLCIRVCADNVKALLFFREENTGKMMLRNEIVQFFKTKPNETREILEKILDNCDCNFREHVPMMFELYRNVKLQQVSLNRMNFSNCEALTDYMFEQMMSVYPVSLEIHNCPNLTSKALCSINVYGKNLEFLHFGNSAKRILPVRLEDWVSNATQRLSLLDTPRLRHLIIWDMDLQNLSLSVRSRNFNYLAYLTRSFITGLEHFELRNFQGFFSLNFLLQAQASLKVLVLRKSLWSNCVTLWKVLPYLGNLRLLDVSECNLDGTDTLEKILNSLPHLSHLDISGNDLKCGLEDGLRRCDTMNILCDHRLDFINLYGTGVSSQLVFARTVVGSNDELLNRLITVITTYIRGELSSCMISSLELISTMFEDDDKFPWKAAFDLLLQVAGRKLELVAVFHILEYMFWKQQIVLAPSQVDQICSFVIENLTCYNLGNDLAKRLHMVICTLPHLFQRICELDHEKVNFWVQRLLRATIDRYEAYHVKEWIELAKIFRLIGDHFYRYLSRTQAGKMVPLEKETLTLVRRLLQFTALPEGVYEMYWKIIDNFVGYSTV